MQVWLRKIIPAVAAIVAIALSVGTLSAQGVTTGAATGLITDQDGHPLAGATVEFVHEPTGFRLTATTNTNGVFTLQGLEPGGPYTVRVRQIGYRPVAQERVFIALGQTFRMNATLEASAVELEEITVIADPVAAEFAPTRTGTRTTIDGEQLADLPTLDRRFTEFAKLTPQIVSTDANNGLGLSVVGQNNRFNTIQIDGSSVNDRFGLGATGAAGGQAQGKPIGLDAIKEFQVELAPFDVRQGNFTGALINVITKGGTNEFQGSAFGVFRDESLAGDPLSTSEFKNWQFGASAGGPIIRDKAHFFVNAEFQEATSPATGPFIGAPSSIAGIRPEQSDIAAMNSVLTGKGLQPGSGGPVSIDNPLRNLTARIDWAVGGNNRAVLRYSYNKADFDVFSRTTSTSNPTFRYDNNAYQFQNNTNNPSFQLFSNFRNGSSNEFRLAYNRIRDQRDPLVKEPQVTVGGFSTAAGDSYRIRTGSERFSQGNQLDQDIIELTDNYTFADKGNHRITVGTRNEYYKVRNLFAQQSFGDYTFATLGDFASDTVGAASFYGVSGNLAGGPVTAARFKASTLGFYAQDQWQVTPKFNVTYGLRVDIPLFHDQPTYAAQVNTDFGNPEVPSGQVLWNPRVGFNWDIDGLGNQQLRGGWGIFTGQPAYVWMSNAYSNNGTGISLLSCGPNDSNGRAPAFNPDPNAQSLSCGPKSDGSPGDAIGNGTFLGEVDIIGKDTKFPQVMRANLAYDRRLPEDFILTIEGMFNQSVNDYFIVNRNVPTAAGTDPNGRVVYGGQFTSGRSDPNYFRPSVYGTGSSGVFELDNTNENYSANVTGQIRKSFGSSLRFSGAYTWSRSKDVQSFTSSRATSNWRFGRVNAGDQFVDNTSLSSFDRTNKVTISGTYLFPWKDYTTQLSLIYVGQSGTPYTYIAGGSSGRGDLNADGTNANDPMYVIRDPNDPGIQWNSGPGGADAVAYDKFISSLDCLNKQRGTIMQRNSCRNPWQNFLDANLRQSLPSLGKNKLTLEIAVFNLLNLIDSSEGLIKSAGGGVFSTQQVGRVTGGTDLGTGNGVQPDFNYTGPTNDPTDPTTATFVNNGQNRNSWQIQFSLRYEYGGNIF